MSYRIAYLVLVYDDPVLFARLARSIESPSSALFVHVDGKSDLSAFKALVPPSDKVFYLEGANRRTVYWGGYSQVAATLNLMRRAMVVKPGFDRLVLLTNADYPIKSLDHIESAFQSDTEFMRVDRGIQLRSADPQSKFLRFHLLDNRLLNPKGLGFSKLGRRITRLVAKIPRSFGDDAVFFHGSQWWALTRKCVDHVLTELDRHPSKYRPFRNMLVPGEILFHSIVKASPFAAKMSQDFTRPDAPPAANEHGAHYIDWSGPHSSSPRWLDETDEQKLVRSPALFGRKFSSQDSARLLDRLDELHRTWAPRRPVKRRS
jgi:hypothetical protein